MSIQQSNAKAGNDSLLRRASVLGTLALSTFGALSAFDEGRAEAQEVSSPAAVRTVDDPSSSPAALQRAEHLPRYNGTSEISALSAPVSISRDSRGVPTIEALTKEDAHLAMGFVHAQERFFQMDLIRRTVLGRLSEVLGQSTIESDRYFRTFQFKEVADRVFDQLPEDQQLLLTKYADGVNSGLTDLAAPPPEYGMLQFQPEKWRAQDAILVYLYIFDALEPNARFEKAQRVMQETLPKELIAFLTPSTTRFEAPLISDGPQQPELKIPGPDIVNLRTTAHVPSETDIVKENETTGGSNNWAVSGKRSKTGSALVASDPHLSLGVPPIWYQASVKWPENHISGASLPGTPGITIGSNDHIAWGFTNLCGDVQDLISLELDPENSNRYKTPDGYESFTTTQEKISVRNAEDITLEIQKTRWGAVSDRDHKGRPLVRMWTALHPEMINMNVLDIASAKTVEEGIAEARKWHGPGLHAMIGDKDGNIGWVVTGYLPNRNGFSGDFPTSWAGENSWNGQLPESERPSLINPESGVLFTANSRTVPLEWSEKLGGAWAPGTRAERISQLLNAKEVFSARDMLDIQLDTRVCVYDQYQKLVAEITEDSSSADMLRAAQIVSDWNGRADSDQPAMRILHAFRNNLHERILSPLLAPCKEAAPSFQFEWELVEESVTRLIEERPLHFLPSSYDSWDALLENTLEETIQRLKDSHPDGLSASWGTQNRVRMNHPLSGLAPELSPLLNFPQTPLPGHMDAIRASNPGYGASMRMVVSPGHPDSAIFELPGGQSGNPWSAHYRTGQKDWIEGNPTPFYSREKQSEFRLIPPESQE